MSFSFGNNQTTASAFSFGNTSTGTTAPSGTGFSFGGAPAASAPTQQASGFSFGAAAQTTSGSMFGGAPTGAAAPFSFSSNAAAAATTSAPAFGGGGFGLGGTKLGATPVVSTGSAGGFSFNAANKVTAGMQGASSFGFGGSAQPSAPAQSTGLPFGQTKPLQSTSSAPASGGFGFGGTAAAPGGGFQLGAAQSQAASTASGFSFGTPTAAATTQKSGFSLTATTTQSGGFGFGATAPASSASLGGFGGLGSVTSKPAALSFGTPAQTQSTGLSLGGSTSTASALPSFGIGQQNPAQKLSFATPAKQITPAGLGAATTSAPTGFSLGGGSTLTSTPATGFKLGGLTTTTAAPAATAATTIASTGLQFGSAGSSGFKLGGLSGLQPTQSTSTTSASASKSLFGSSSTAAAPSALTPSASGISFGGKPATAAATSSGGPTTSTSLPALGLASASSSATGFKLPDTTNPKQPLQSTSKPATLSLGGGLKLGTTTAAATATTTAASGAAAATSQTPSLRYKDLETKINKWTSELEQQEHLFLTQATQVNAWNKLLIDNSEKITALNGDFERVQCDQERLNQELDFIRTQEQELEELLRPLEESTRQQAASLSASVHTHHADMEREKTYNLAENVDGQMKRMVQDLREVIDHINTSTAPADSSNPINQISKILSAHMDSLQWLDGNSTALQRKLDELNKQVTSRKMEQESRFRLAFD